MSMLLMVKAMNAKVGNSSRKLVLIKLADHANDKGICWPSHDHIAEQCEMSKRTVIRHIEELEKQGLIKVVQRKREGEAFNKTNLYYLSLDDSANLSLSNQNDSDILSNDSDILSNDSDNLSQTIVTQCHPNQSLITSHKTEPVKEPINKRTLDLSHFEQAPSDRVWSDYLEHRKNKKAKLTQTALNLLIKQINQCLAFGYSTDEVLAECMARGWIGFKSEWILKNNQSTQSSSFMTLEERNRLAFEKSLGAMS